MNSLNHNEPDHCIETELEDILTINSCSTLVSELIKFILYRKQQLPYTYDRLKYLITKKIDKEKQESTNKISTSVERQFKLAEDGLTTLELLFEKTKEELAGTGNGGIIEVALLFGSTPMTPKQVYRIHLPEISRCHSSVHHPERKHLIHLLQSVILSNSLSDMLKKPLNPTNMYVFIKKNNNSCDIRKADNLNKWFIPKNKYEIPKTGQHFHIRFKQPLSQMSTCACQDFKIYSDQGETSRSSISTDLDLQGQTESTWFQACSVFRGFTDVYINGVSVADLWLR